MWFCLLLIRGINNVSLVIQEGISIYQKPFPINLYILSDCSARDKTRDFCKQNLNFIFKDYTTILMLNKII